MPLTAFFANRQTPHRVPAAGLTKSGSARIPRPAAASARQRSSPRSGPGTATG